MVSFDAILLSLALGIDAAVVAFAIGLAHPDKSHRPGIKLAAWFGFFQAGMALIGWATVNGFEMLRPWAQKSASIIFILLGLKLLYDVIRPAFDGQTKVPKHHHEFLLLAIATSVDVGGRGIV